MDRYPGAYWRPAGTYQGAMSRLDGMTFHEAVTRATVPTSGRSNIAGWVDSADACHGFIGPDGAAEQFKEFNELAWGVKDGNYRLVTWETWDGLSVQTELDVNGKGPNESPWTPEQAERIADIMAWGSVVLGIPLRLMAASNPGEKGYAPHRLGIDPWRTGSELWTKARGKQCPGDMRVAQLPSIVARAQRIAGAVQNGVATWLPAGPVDLKFALARGTVVSPSTPSTPSTNPTAPEADVTPDQIQAAVVAALNSSQGQLAVKKALDDRLRVQFGNAEDPNSILNRGFGRRLRAELRDAVNKIVAAKR